MGPFLAQEQRDCRIFRAWRAEQVLCYFASILP
jgi:hypothetical protein